MVVLKSSGLNFPAQLSLARYGTRRCNHLTPTEALRCQCQMPSWNLSAPTLDLNTTSSRPIPYMSLLTRHRCHKTSSVSRTRERNLSVDQPPKISNHNRMPVIRSRMHYKSYRIRTRRHNVISPIPTRGRSGSQSSYPRNCTTTSAIRT